MFPLGQVVATPGALEALAESNQNAQTFLARHASGDWGDVSCEDWQANNHALTNGGRILSAYRTAKEKKLWVVTEADRSATTLMLPEEY